MTDKVENNEMIEDQVVETQVDDQIEESAAADSLKPASKPAADPKSRIEMMTAVLKGMDAMPKRDFVKWFDQQQAVFGPGKDLGVGDKSAANQSSVDMKGGAGPKTKDPMPKISVKEDVEEMFVGEELSEDFKEKASVLFEAAVSARMALEVARLEEEYKDNFASAVATMEEETTDKLDSYLDYVVENWMKENEVAIESTLRNELMEEFIDGLKNLFAEHYITVPEEKINVIEELANKVSELEGKLNDSINENHEMKKSIVESQRKEVLESALESLTVTQQEKFRALAEGLDFDGDLEVYTKKLSIVKENYFSSEKKAVTSTNIEEETFEGETAPQPVFVDPAVNRYMQAISRTVKR